MSRPGGGAEQSHLHISQDLEPHEPFACGVPRGEEVQDQQGPSEEEQAPVQDHSSDRTASIPPREPQPPFDQTAGVPACILYTLYIFCTVLRDRETLRGAQRRLEEDEEEGRTESAATTSAQPAVERRGTKNKGTGTTSAQPATHGKETKSKGTGTTSAQPAVERKETKSKGTGTTSAQPAMERRGAQRAASASTQTITHPGQPKPAAAAPVQKKKSKSKSPGSDSATWDGNPPPPQQPGQLK